MAIGKLNIKGRSYYFYNDLINIKNLNNNNKLKLDKKCVWGNDVYYIEYITKKPQCNVYSVNLLYLIINKIKGHFEEVDGDKYLIISSENGNIMQKYQEDFDGIKIKNIIQKIIKKINDYGQLIKYDENYMKIKFNTDDNIPLNKIIYFPNIIIIIRSITKKDDKYYPQLFLDDCLYEV